MPFDLDARDFGAIIWTVLASGAFILYYNGESRRLRHIPTVGSDLPFLSWITAYKFQVRIKEVVAEGVRKYPSGIFKAPDSLHWMVIVAGARHVEEYLKVPESTFSSFSALDEFFWMAYTFDPRLVGTASTHFSPVRTQLNKSIPQSVVDMNEEIVDCLPGILPKTSEWTPIKNMQQLSLAVISQATNRIFVGLPLCRNKEFVDLTTRRSQDVFKAAVILGMIPGPLKGLVNSMMPTCQRQIDTATELLQPLIQERRTALASAQKSGEDATFSDYLTWLIDGAEGVDAQSRILTCRLLAVNLASLHTTSLTLTNALYDLAAYPQYAGPMREEIIEAVNTHGWTTEGLDAMYKVDSFIKESQRMNPSAELPMNRIALKDYTFFDGTRIPKGTHLAVAISPAHLNEEYYHTTTGDADPGPEEFDGFRFLKLREARGKDSDSAARKFDIPSTNTSFLAWGHGIHACPGRFFASYELKLLLAHIVLGYDLKMDTGQSFSVNGRGGGGKRNGKAGVRPDNVTVNISSFPNPECALLFRKRN